MTAERKLGKFRVAHELLKQWKDLLPVFASVVVVRAESLYMQDCIEYVAFCDQFEPVPPGCPPLDYVCDISTNEAGVDVVKWSQSDDWADLRTQSEDKK